MRNIYKYTQEFPLPFGQGIQKRTSLFEDFTEYEYQIYSYIALLTECKYWIYYVLARWPNSNIEYIHSQQLGRIWISNMIIKLENWEFVFKYLNIWCLFLEYSNIFVLHWSDLKRKIITSMWRLFWGWVEWRFSFFSYQNNWIML